MIEEILRKKIGLDTERIGLKKIHADALYRMNQCGISDMRKYVELVQHSPEELSRLIEIITVPETWFFRIKDTFKFLEKYIRTDWLVGQKNRKLRVLSMPCATGEEPYSIAMTFFECGLNAEDFHIDAADINEVCIEKARKAVYSHHAFREGKSEELIKKYFITNEKTFELKQNVKDAVHFFQKNIFDYSIADSGSKYDIVFCRNMLIYLDDENQKKAIDILTGVLRDDGLIFLGHSESGIFFNTKFVSVKEKGSFAFRVQNPDLPPQNFTHEKHKPHKRYTPEYHEKLTESEKRKPAAAAISTEEQQNDSELFQQAESSANAGDLKTAEKLCREYMKHNKLDEKAYFLMGMVLMAAGKYMEAEVFFHKAVYVKPDYYDALLSLASVKERSGDLINAGQLKERAKRIKNSIS